MSLADRKPPTPEEYAAYRQRFCNWGRWGPDDELGTLNFATPEVRRAAAALVREGRTVSLGRTIDTHAGPRNPFPAHHFWAIGESGGLADYIGLFFHGFANSHVDALSHFPTVDGSAYYNGRPVGPTGHLPAGKTCSIDHWREGLVTRGVLYDIPRLRGVDHVAPGRPVHGWELLDAAAAQRVEPRSGDAVLIRCGRDRFFAAHPEERGWSAPAGVHASTLEFLHEREAALLVWDMLDAPVADQGIPNPMPIEVAVHVHSIAIAYMGMPLVDNANFEELAARCAALGRWEFLFVLAPLVIEGGTGSPANPLAIL
jgi:kynurenine formamidase